MLEDRFTKTTQIPSHTEGAVMPQPQQHTRRNQGEPHGQGRRPADQAQGARSRSDGQGRRRSPHGRDQQIQVIGGASQRTGIGSGRGHTPKVWWSVPTFDRPSLDDYAEANLSAVFDALPGLFRYAPHSAIGVARFFSMHQPSPDTMRFWSRAGDALADFLAQYRPTKYTLAIAEGNLIDAESLSTEMAPVDIRDVLGPKCTYAGQLYGMLVNGEIRDERVIEDVATLYLAAANGFKRTHNARRQAECRLPLGDVLLQLGKPERARTEMVQGIVLLGTADKNDALIKAGMAVDPAVGDSILRETTGSRQPAGTREHETV